MKTKKSEKELRSEFKTYAEGYIESSCIYDNSLFTQAYKTGLAPVSPGGYFLADGIGEDILLQVGIYNFDELPKPESGYLEDSIEEYWQNQLAGIFYEAACEFANKIWGVGGWYEDTVPENGGWKHKVLYKMM